MSRARPRRGALRGVPTRLLSMVLGLVVAAGLIVGMQLPLRHQPATFTLSVSTSPLVTAASHLPPIAWPSSGSAAVSIPALDVVMAHHDRVVPIASLTKMMTAYVTLKKLPLAAGESGPCLYVSSEVVAAYKHEKMTDQSTILVTLGERLCEFDLLNGLLVHSGSDYAIMLASLVSATPEGFVALMNQAASSLGLTSTHYEDESGISPLSVSTATDQARLAVLLMKSPLVRSIVRQPSVVVPVAGVVTTFTPYVGVDNVVGVKSGRTDAAGGCDVMAMTFQMGGLTRIIYAVVLGQRGGDLLGPAGDAALALATSAVANRVQVTLPTHYVVGHVGWQRHQVAFAVARASEVTFWAPMNPRPFSVRMRHFTTKIHRGETVGWLEINGVPNAVPLVALRTVAPPTLWQRLL